MNRINIRSGRVGALQSVKGRDVLLLLVSSVAIAACAGATSGGQPAPAAEVAAGPPPEMLRAAPATRLKVLFLGDNAAHTPTPRAKSLLPVLAQRGIDMYYTDNVADLKKDGLKNYHAVILYNNQPSISPEQVSALLGFVRDGGGLVAIHSASAAFQNSPDYIALIGASVQRQSTDTVTTTIAVPDHPILQGLQPIRSLDERFVFTNHNPMGRTVLATRAEGATQEPWTWVRNEGNGRVFYTGWGHDASTWTNPNFQDMIDRALRWSVGDWGSTKVEPSPVAATMELTAPLPNYPPPAQVAAQLGLGPDGSFGQGGQGQPAAPAPVAVPVAVPGQPGQAQGGQAQGGQAQGGQGQGRGGGPGQAGAPGGAPGQPGAPAQGGGGGGGGGGGRQMGTPFTTAQISLSVEESTKLMTVPPGFHVEPYASESLIYRPIDINWDERGRTWVVETLDYPDTILAEGVPGHDRILILEDTNRDGRADRNIVFADKLNLASSMMFINGGVVVSVARQMLFLKDTNGDDRADTREVLNSGWRINDTHGMASNLQYGYDNRVWHSVGYNGFNGTIDGKTLTQADYAAGVYSFKADGTDLNYIARTSNNTWGLGFTEDNFVFQSTANNRPSQFVGITGNAYRSIGLTTPVVMLGIADRNDMFTNRRYMQVDQYGNYTAGSGHHIYTARAYPREFWNRAAFVTEPTGHVVGMFDLQSNGSSFIARNRWSLMASQDAWSAPVQAKVGPDGAVWVSDFYSLVAQHNPTPQGFTTQPGAAYNTPYRSKDHGRIYRIVYDNAPTPTLTSLANATPAQLVAALKNDNRFWRITAQRLLVDRRQTDVVPALLALLNDRSVDELGLNVGALHALWTLDGLGVTESDPAVLAAVRAALTHPAPSLKRAALEVLPRDAQLAGAIFAPNGIGNDPDLHVRLAAVLTASELPGSSQGAAYANSLLGNVANLRDPLLPEAIAIAGFKHGGTQFLYDLIQRPAADSAATAGVARAVNMLARAYAIKGVPNTEIVISLIERVPQASPPIKAAILTGILMGNVGWPPNAPPTLTDAQRASLKAAAAGASPADVMRFNAIAARWAMPGLFDQ